MAVILCLLCARRARADAKSCVLAANDAADQRALHHLLAARQIYQQCTADPECPAVVRTECEASLAELTQAVPTFIVRVVDEQRHDLLDAQLTLDGRAIPIDGAPLSLDPGPHELVATRGSLVNHVPLVAGEFEVDRHIEIVLSAPAPVVVKEAKPIPRPLSYTTPTPPERSYTASYVLGGVGALGLASFGILALSGHSDLSALDTCKPECTHSEVQRVHTKYQLADASLGVSVIAFATAGYLYWSSSHEPRASAPGSLSVAVNPVPGRASVSLQWVE